MTIGVLLGDNVLWRWFHRNLGACSICSLRLFFGLCSSFHQVDYLPLAVHRWAPSSTCQGQFKFYLLHEVLSDCASQTLSLLPLSYLHCLSEKCTYVGSLIIIILQEQGTYLVSLLFSLYPYASSTLYIYLVHSRYRINTYLI